MRFWGTGAEWRGVALALLVFLLQAKEGAAAGAAVTYTLYRGAPIQGMESARIHVATFDAQYEDDSYNLLNCQLAAELFAHQQGVIVHYWCERGRYQP